MSYHSNMDHLVTLLIIVEKCRNNTTNLLCCFVDLRKYFGTIPKTNLWNRLEEIKVPFKLRDVVIRLYENVIVKFRNIEGWWKKLTVI
jgi:hypothetical protein